MIWPQFSEFSFGYAFTDNLVNRVLTGIKGVPIFPSLKQEGRAGVGYDVKIPTRSAPVFLQFKLPQIVKRHRSIWKHDLVAPYYRIHDAPHHIAYRAGPGTGWLCSAPRRLQRHTGSDVFLEEVRRLVADAPVLRESSSFFDSLAAEIIATALKAEFEEREDAVADAATSSFPEFLDPQAEMRRLSPFRERFGAGRFAAYVSRLYLDCELIIVGRDN